MRVPMTARRWNQSILKEINPEYSSEGLVLKLRLQYFGHLMWRADSLKKTWHWERLKARGEGDRGWDVWMTSLTQWTWVWAPGDNKRQGNCTCICFDTLGRHEREVKERWPSLSAVQMPYGTFQGNSSCCRFCWQVTVGGSCSSCRSLSNHLQLKSLHVTRNKSSYTVTGAGSKQQKQNNQNYCNQDSFPPWGTS